MPNFARLMTKQLQLLRLYANYSVANTLSQILCRKYSVTNTLSQILYHKYSVANTLSQIYSVAIHSVATITLSQLPLHITNSIRTITLSQLLLCIAISLHTKSDLWSLPLSSPSSVVLCQSRSDWPYILCQLRSD